MSCEIMLHFEKLFYCRNLNTIRAIAHEHGDPVDRYSVLARAATKSAFQSEGSLTRRVCSFPTLVLFEIKLQ